MAHAHQSDEMQQQAIDVSQTAFEKFSIEKDIAQYIKKEVCRDQRSGLYAVSIQQYGSYGGSSSMCAQEQHGIASSAGTLEASSHTVYPHETMNEEFKA